MVVSLLCEMYIFYADVYFIQNFIIKVAVLYLSLYCNKLHFLINSAKGIRKIALASFVGTLIEIIGLLLGFSYNLFLVFVYIFEIPLMIKYILGKKSCQMVKVIVIGYLFVIIINGVLEVIWNWFGEYGNYIFFVVVSCVMVLIGVATWRRYYKMQNGIFAVKLFQNERWIEVKGLYDSGNKLKDTYTGNGVYIVSKRIAQRLKINEAKKVFVPYHSLGNVDDVIEVYYIEKLEIQDKNIEIRDVPIGVAEEKLFENKNYEMILNEEVF